VEPVLLDEWQEVPGVFGAARRAVDADPRPNRFLLTGSVRAEHEHEVWPGTGRFLRVAMHPMSVRERSGDADAKSFLDKLADGDALAVPADTPDLRGYVELALESGFPTAALMLSGRGRRSWLQSYLQDLLTHDVEVLEQPATKRRDSERLRRYFEAYALNSAGIADHKTIFDAAGVTKVTAVGYEDLLARLLVVDQMPAWTSNRLKRLVQTPKRYVVDPSPDRRGAAPGRSRSAGRRGGTRPSPRHVRRRATPPGNGRGAFRAAPAPPPHRGRAA
jgi:predicted AAA+ superfamily ATPase